MSTTKLQKHIDAAGRLAAVINELGFDCEHLDVIVWCADVNVLLDSDTKTPVEAFEVMKE